MECEHETEEYISPISLQKKKDGKILTSIQPNFYMATIDLKEAYYSAKTDGHNECFLNFFCNSKLLKFVILLNCFSSGP